jgi:hypothetical protein
MTDYAYDMPLGRELEADPPTWCFGVDYMTATPGALAICRDAGFRELSAEEIDYSRTTTASSTSSTSLGIAAITPARSTAHAMRGSIATTSCHPATWSCSPLRTARRSSASASAMFRGDTRPVPICASDPTSCRGRHRRSHGDQQAPQEVPEPA